MIPEIVHISVLLFFIFVFHAGEYIISKINHPESVSISSTLVTAPFAFSLSFGIIEFLIESYIFGDFKTSFKSVIMWVGFLFIIVGLTIRVLAETTAKKAFTHHVAQKRVEEHKLITHGVYKYFRHPGYFGMFLFSVGSQLFLKNVISTIVFISVLWCFFNERIKMEERLLVSMFGRDYVEYRSHTPTRIPFIK